MKAATNHKDAITTYEFVYKCECCDRRFYDKFKIGLPLDAEGVGLWFKDSRTNTKVHICFDNVEFKRYGVGKLIGIDLYKKESNTGYLGVS